MNSKLSGSYDSFSMKPSEVTEDNNLSVVNEKIKDLEKQIKENEKLIDDHDRVNHRYKQKNWEKQKIIYNILKTINDHNNRLNNIINGGLQQLNALFNVETGFRNEYPARRAKAEKPNFKLVIPPQNIQKSSDYTPTNFFKVDPSKNRTNGSRERASTNRGRTIRRTSGSRGRTSGRSRKSSRK